MPLSIGWQPEFTVTVVRTGRACILPSFFPNRINGEPGDRNEAVELRDIVRDHNSCQA